MYLFDWLGWLDNFGLRMLVMMIAIAGNWWSWRSGLKNYL